MGSQPPLTCGSMAHEAGFRCRKCRLALFTSANIVSSHGEPWTGHVSFICPLSKADTVWYVREQDLPEWMLDQINCGDWVKGKLYCPTCSARLGSFDFVTGAKCDCGEFVLPPIHLSKSRIDCDQAQQTQAILHQIVRPPISSFSQTTLEAGDETCVN